jgi:hypothetical protein
MARFDAMAERFEEVTVFGRPALFTALRIDRSTVPSGYHLYEIRHDDDCMGDAVQIAEGILVNHWGSVVMRDKLRFPPMERCLDMEPEDLSYGTGDCQTMKEFAERYPPRTKPPKDYER